MPTNKGDILVVPAFNSGTDNDKRVTVKWQQSLSQKSAEYYALVVKNKTQGGWSQSTQHFHDWRSNRLIH
jgi:hypothetical protein